MNKQNNDGEYVAILERISKAARKINNSFNEFGSTEYLDQRDWDEMDAALNAREKYIAEHL